MGSSESFLSQILYSLTPAFIALNSESKLPEEVLCWEKGCMCVSTEPGHCMAQVPGSFASVTLFLLVPKLWTRKGPKSGMTYLIIGILKNSCEPVLGFPGGSDGKDSACNAGNPVSISGLGRSPGEGNGNPLQYSCLENPMDRRAWRTNSLWGCKESDTAE